MASVLYVYGITRDPAVPECDAIDQSRRFGTVTAGSVSATFTEVEAEEFSQEVIDQRAGDLEWLGAIGYRHQEVLAALMNETTVLPLRAFTLFSGERALAEYLTAHQELLERTLERLTGKREWTLRVELEPQRWSQALSGRVQSLRGLEDEIETAAPGKAFLLRKKLEEERKRASASAETDLLSEIERTVTEALRCEIAAEPRERRGGAFPQINVLIERDEESRLQELHASINSRYESEGVSLALSGPWPPYTFAAL